MSAIFAVTFYEDIASDTPTVIFTSEEPKFLTGGGVRVGSVVLRDIRSMTNICAVTTAEMLSVLSGDTAPTFHLRP